jgi:hypothetical protein
MTLGTLFTLFVVPVFYSLIATDHRLDSKSEERESRPLTFETGNAALEFAS